jgi:serine/threonine protein kinase
MKKAKEEGLENRIDVYQLANLMLYMLTGESIDGEEAIDRKHVEEKLSEIPNKELRETLAKALDPDPAKRPSSEELTKALYRIYEKMA